MYTIINSDECKKLIFETLKFIDDICKKNDIEYTLEFGTLLGAYRHKGFIPWDDDIDIAMTRENYNKFLEVMKENPDEKFYLLSKEFKENYPFEFAKVMMKDTVLIIDDNGGNMIMDRGIFVDIFTLDYYNKPISKLYMDIIRKFENIRKDSVINSVNSKVYKIIFKFIKILSSIIIPMNLVEGLKKKSISSDGQYLGFAIEQSSEMICKKEDYFPLKEIEFEGSLFPCPKSIEKILEIEYGQDYMELPPEEDRVRHFEYGAIEEKVALNYSINIQGKKRYTIDDIINKRI